MLKRIITIIQLCWMPSQISKEKAIYYRYRQYVSLLNTVPLLSITTYIIIILGLILCWKIVSHQLLLFSALILFLQSSGFLLLWKKYVLDKREFIFKPIHISISVISIGLIALIYSYISFQLFISINVYHKIALTGVSVAIASIGCWMFASLPLAGILWSLLIPGILSILLLHSGPDYYLIAGLAIFYCFFLCAAVLITSFRYLQSLVYETEVKDQRELIKLLFNDFEENTKDWLWEIDNKGFMRHISVQLINSIKLSKAEIKEKTFVDIIEEFSPPYSNISNQLKKVFLSAKDFKDVILPVFINGEERWWLLKAKPLFNEKGILSGWRGVTVDITELRLKELEVIKLGNEDPLTGISNRFSFNSALSKLFSDLNDLNSCCLIIFELEGFDNINQLLGPDVGDEFLKNLVQRLLLIVPNGVLLSRIGDDTFSLIIKRDLKDIIVKKIIRDIHNEISTPVFMSGNKINVKVNIGISYAPENANNANDLIKTANIALDDAKNQQFNNISFFTEELREGVLYKQRLIVDLASASFNNELAVFYQPQVDLSSGKLIGFEALLRWNHPAFGMISPDIFIPLAEKSQAIVSLGEWVLNRACCDAIDWPDSLSVAVNVSGVQLQHLDFSQCLSKALMVSGLVYNRLVLEITETAFTTTNEETILMLENFRSRGGRIAIDDFGTGYSSFSYLHSFPLDKLKIDRSFVQLLDSTKTHDKGKAIIKSIVRLGNTLGLGVLVEGIESKSQLKELKKMQCDFAQGYLFSKPLPIDEVKGFIDNYEKNGLV